LSLLEVLIALAIFLLSLTALIQLVDQGSDRAVEAQQQAQAIMVCQAKLAEVAAGSIPINSSQTDVPLDEDPRWLWSLDSEQGAATGLWNVTIRVCRPRPDGSRMEVALSQLILDPSYRGNNQKQQSGSGNSGDPNASGGGTSTPSTGGN
jgi:type II secretion system protein I